MFVGRRMTRNVVSVTKDASVLHVRNLLREKDINQVPVVEGRRVIGVITDGDIREYSASPASTLSVHELELPAVGDEGCRGHHDGKPRHEFRDAGRGGGEDPQREAGNT